MPRKADPIQDIHDSWADHPAWCRACLSIEDKAGIQRPLELWPAQRKLHDVIARQRKLGKPVRIVVLKPRRVAISVAVSAEFFHEVPFLAGQHAMVIAHDGEAAEETFGYYGQFQKSYKPHCGMIALDKLKSESASQLEWTNGSYIKVATANNTKKGRAFSLRYLHLDEFAFYRDAATLMTGLMQSVPSDPATMVIVSSTANGVGGPFYELWRRANEPSEISEWVGLFFAWWEHPEYARPVPRPDEFQRSLGVSPQYGDELAERALYNLTLEQLAWRRWCIVNQCDRSVQKFNQEYPASPEGAFLTSGRPRFSHKHLARMAIVRDPMRGRIEVLDDGTRTQALFLPDEQGELAIYRKPERGGLYVIGADAASGKDINDGKGNEDRDFCVACVIDASNGEQVAKWRARIEPAPFGVVLCALGRYYNWAYQVPEANTWGIGVLEQMLREQYPIGQIYERGRSPSDRHTESVHKIGFETTSVTREQLISALDIAIREYAVLIRDAQTLAECLTFVITARGRAEGQQGCHDDEVFALGLAVMGLRTMPRRKAQRPAELPPPVRPYRGRRITRQADRTNDQD